MAIIDEIRDYLFFAMHLILIELKGKSKPMLVAIASDTELFGSYRDQIPSWVLQQTSMEKLDHNG